MGIIVAGNNINQKFIIDNYKKYLKEPEYINPLYAISYADTDLMASISEILAIKGLGYTVGGSSASGNLGIYNAYHLVKHGYVKACLAVGALADFSELELQAFSILGAISCNKYNEHPQKASRPFDKNHKGFVYGQGSGCILLESLENALKREANILGEVIGASIVLDGNHLSNPSLEGEARAMSKAVAEANIDIADIQYINTHGTSSPLGDETELAAIKAIFKDRIKDIYINSTKSMVGHCIYSAGIIELIATILQMNEGFLHPNLNLDEPIDPDFLFVGKQMQKANIEYALSNSFGFGGFNSSIALNKYLKEGTINESRN
jgi:malonyl-ACP decarboxylase